MSQNLIISQWTFFSFRVIWIRRRLRIVIPLSIFSSLFFLPFFLFHFSFRIIFATFFLFFNSRSVILMAMEGQVTHRRKKKKRPHYGLNSFSILWGEIKFLDHKNPFFPSFFFVRAYPFRGQIIFKLKRIVVFFKWNSFIFVWHSARRSFFSLSPHFSS